MKKSASKSPGYQKRRKLTQTSTGLRNLPAELADGMCRSDSKEGPVFEHVHDTTDSCIKEYMSISKVGYVPFNSNKVNQDRVTRFAGLGPKKDCYFFGVLDGHGVRGEDVSGFVLKNFIPIINKISRFTDNPKDGLKRAFADMTTSLVLSPVNCSFSGTTAVCSWIQGKKIYTANCGDSRAVLARLKDGKLVAKDLSTDQKPDDKGEKERIIEMNGRVEPCKGVLGNPIGPARVWLKSQDMPGLAMSRSFGDDVATSVGVISVPQLTEHDITPEDKMVIWASDGVWEFISSQDAVDMIANCKSADVACKLLVQESVVRWKKEEEVIDDISALVVFLEVKME